MKLTGSTVLVTGASRGIGRAVVVHFARKGARVLFTGRNEDGLRETMRRLEAEGLPGWWRASDLRRPETLESLVEAIEQAGFAVDILLNNAADLTSKPLLETPLDEIDTIIRANLTGCLQLCRLVGPGMLARGSGMIVNMSSLAGYKPNPTQTVYSISKGAVNSLSEALRAEWSARGIKIMNVGLGSVSTEEIPRPSKPDAWAFAQRLEAAIVRERTDLFLSPVSQWLMRLYAAFPVLMRR